MIFYAKYFLEIFTSFKNMINFCFGVFFMGLLTMLVTSEMSLKQEQSLQTGHIADMWNEIRNTNKLQPLVQQPYIMFWRPQKVGSSTILSVLLSYAYRYNVLHRRRSLPNSFCMKIAKCGMDYYNSNRLNLTSGNRLETIQGLKKFAIEKLQDRKEVRAEQNRYQMCITHQLCNLHSSITEQVLSCAFASSNHLNQLYKVVSPILSINTTRELTIVRDPLARAISIYYFWGELYKMRPHGDQLPNIRIQGQQHRNLAVRERIGMNKDFTGLVKGAMFNYHGNESSSPPPRVAMAFATKLPLNKGMPGPSHTWSAFSNSPEDAVAVIKTDRIMTLVTERLDESLVVASHYLNWSLADVVVTVHRKALSTHPKHTDWPPRAIETIKTKLQSNGEYAVYDAAKGKLDSRIADLRSKGVDIEEEVKTLRSLRTRITKLCLSEEDLERYRSHLAAEGLTKHKAENKLRDAEDFYTEKGHSLSFNGDILYSFDVCGSCEAHALLVGVRMGLGKSVGDAPPLKSLPLQYRQGNVNFDKCP